jgi:4-hydroxy-2-oxoheptanedioate aldolase
VNGIVGWRGRQNGSAKVFRSVESVKESVAANENVQSIYRSRARIRRRWTFRLAPRKATLAKIRVVSSEPLMGFGERRMGRIKQRLAAGETVRLFGVGQVYSPKLIEIIGVHGLFDGLWLDAEHAGLGMKEIELATLAANCHGLDHFVRMPATDYASIMRALEAGAGGVMISMVRSPDDADQAVRWAKFWPRGNRGLNGGNRDGKFGLIPIPEYVARANAETFVGIQIETSQAIESVADIAAIDDIDLIFVGPADISQVLGVPGDFENPKCLDTIERIARACERAGKPWGIVPRGPEYAARMAEWGCRMFVLGFDIHAVHAGIRTIKERYAGFFPPS